MRRQVAGQRDREPGPRRRSRTRRARRASPPSPQSCAEREQIGPGGLDQQPVERALAVEVERRRPPATTPSIDLGELRPAELGEGLAEQVDRARPSANAVPDGEPVVLEQPEHPDHRRRPDRRVAGLVVEAHVAAGDRRLERAARVGHPADRLGELPHHLGPLRVAEVQAVGDRERRRARCRRRCAPPRRRRARRRGRGRARRTDPCRRVESASAFSVPSIRTSAASPPGPSTVPPCTSESYCSHTHRLLATFGDASTRQERVAGRRRERSRTSGRPRRGPRRSGGSADRARVDRTLVGERAGRDLGDRAAARDARAGGRPASSRPITAEARPHRAQTARTSSSRRGCDDREHPLLRLADVRISNASRSGLAERDGVEVELGAEPGPGRGLAHGAREPGAARGPGAPRAGRARPARARPRSAACRRTDRRSARSDGSPRRPPRASARRAPTRRRSRRGRSTRRTGRSSDPSCTSSARRDQPVGRRDADAHHVHGRVRRVRLGEAHLAADRRHPDAVAVAADPGHHAVEQPAVALLRERAEPQRVEQRDRSRPHRDDVADDPADPGRGALVRLDRARVRVRLHLEHDREAVADVDRAGVLPGADQDRGTLGRQAPQVDLRATCTSSARTTSRAYIASSVAVRARGRGSRRSGSSSSSVSPSCRWSGSAALTRRSRVASADASSDANIGWPPVDAHVRVDGVLGMRHQADDVARLVADAGDRVRCCRSRCARRRSRRRARSSGTRPARRPRCGADRPRGATNCPSPCLTGTRSTSPGDETRRERRERGLDADVDPPADEPELPVPDQRAGQQPGLAQDLEPVADPDDGPAALGERPHLVHDRREPRDRAASAGSRRRRSRRAGSRRRRRGDRDRRARARRPRRP